MAYRGVGSTLVTVSSCTKLVSSGVCRTLCIACSPVQGLFPGSKTGTALRATCFLHV